MGTLVDLTGMRFGRLEAIRIAGTDKRGEKLWECYCECGTLCNVLSSNLRTGHTKSCGCLDREKSSERMTKHGRYGTGTYESWTGMIQRCTNPNHTHYDRYGGRGITIHPPWMVFSNFYADMGEKPDGFSIERIDNSGNYEPGNCKWISPKEQARNRENNVEITFNDKTQCIAAW